MKSEKTTAQATWEETSEEVERRRRAQHQEPGWTGTIVGLLSALAAMAALLLAR